MNAADTLRLPSAHMSEVRARFGVQSLAMFGSTARSQTGPESDLDVLVEFAGRPTFDNYTGLKLFLEQLFGVSVDLAIQSDLRPEMRSRIAAEALTVT